MPQFFSWPHIDCNDTLKDSLAAALRHSQEQTQNNYDWQMANEKKAAVLDLARWRAEEEPDREAVGASDQPSETNVTVAQFVGLIGEESTLQKSYIFLGCVQICFQSCTLLF